MIILRDNFNKIIEFESYIALGNFDGLHLGHRSLINRTLQLSEENHVKSLVYTFENHPLSIVYPEKMPKLLMDNETKIALLEKLGVDAINLAQFNIDFMKISPEDFIKNLVRYYRPKGIIVGFNYRFGYKNKGDINLLSEYSKILGFELYVIDSVYYDNEIVSSSKVRDLLTNGQVEKANKMLLMPYMLKGKVVKGKQLGRTIGFPTANLYYDNNFILPSIGVYYTTVEYDGLIYKGITSVGYNPTVEIAASKIFIETYILDFNKNIYGETLKVYFMDRIRDEIKFQSLNELTEQLIKDKLYAEEKKIENFS